MKYKLKSPIIKKTPEGRAQGLRMLGQKLYGPKQFQKITKDIPQMALAALPSQVEKEYMEPELSISGILLVIVFYLTFMYVYGTAWWNIKLTWTDKDDFGITLSDAFKSTEKIGATLLYILMSGLFVGLLIEKGFISEHASDLKISLVSVCFVILASFLLMFLVTPSKQDKYQMFFHVSLATLALLFMAYASFIFTYLYNDIYVSEGIIAHLTNSTYVLAACIIFMFLLFPMYMLIPIYYSKKISKIIGLTELMMILVYGIILGLVTVLPKLVDYESLCISLGFGNNS